MSLSRQLKSIVHSSVELNDELHELTIRYVNDYNNMVHKLNDMITNIHNNDVDLVEQVTPFIGNSKRLLTNEEMNMFLSDDHKLVSFKQEKTNNDDLELISSKIRNDIKLSDSIEIVDKIEGENILLEKKEVKFSDEYDIIMFDKDEPVINK